MGIGPQSKGNGAVASSQPSLAEKLRFLSAPSAYRGDADSVEIVETHMSYVFLAGERAYKLKKPVIFPYLDFSTLKARELDCREELRLNRRLAPQTYLAVAPLCFAQGQFSIGGDGEIVDWLVLMRRLPRELMLDRLISQGEPGSGRFDAICETLGRFYFNATPSTISPQDYGERFLREQKTNRDILLRRSFALDHGRAPLLLERLDRCLEANLPLLRQRVTEGRVVDGHGDLRPEHICLCEPIVIFDCLEFNEELRQVDPFDELAFLGMECAQLGAVRLGPDLIRCISERLKQEPPWRLTALYAASRAMLRARLTLAHLLDETPREPAKWEPLASRYLDLAEQALTALG
jgi:uncharacterized protein